MHQTRNDLPEKTRAAMVELLNKRLADLIDLQLQAKQAHWNVKGPTFIALHELFDSVYEDVSGFVDTVAERATALGGVAEGTLPAVKSRTQLAEYPLKLVNGRDHVEALATAMATAGKAIRNAIDEADEAGDKGTSDLFTGISRAMDMKLWFVEAHVQGT